MNKHAESSYIAALVSRRIVMRYSVELGRFYPVRVMTEGER